MKAFIHKYEDRIHGVLSCFDRMLFRGYLPIMSGWQMAQFFNSSGIRFREESRQNKRQPGGVSWRDSVTVWVLCQPGSGHRPGQAETRSVNRPLPRLDCA